MLKKSFLVFDEAARQVKPNGEQATGARLNFVRQGIRYGGLSCRSLAYTEAKPTILFDFPGLFARVLEVLCATTGFLFRIPHTS